MQTEIAKYHVPSVSEIRHFLQALDGLARSGDLFYRCGRNLFPVERISCDADPFGGWVVPRVNSVELRGLHFVEVSDKLHFRRHSGASIAPVVLPWLERGAA